MTTIQAFEIIEEAAMANFPYPVAREDPNSYRRQWQIEVTNAILHLRRAIREPSIS